MASMAAETLNKILWITGNVDRKGSETLTGSLEEYVRKVGEVNPVVDMSSVGYFSTSAAKALIMVAQDVQARKQKLTVRASPQVTQTLTMLGASSWLQIETCAKPNAKPEAGSASPAGAAAPAEDAGMDLELPPDGDMNLELPPDAAAGAGGPSVVTSANNYAPTVHIRPAAAKRNTVITKPGPSGSTVLGQGIRGDDAKEKSPEEEAVERAFQFEGQPLVDNEEDLPEDLQVLKRLRVLKTYTFHFGADSEITAKAIERTVGPWVLVDARGTRRLVNLRLVNYIDVL